MHRFEEDELYLRAAQAWELRDSSYFRDAVEEIVVWTARRRQSHLERRQDETARLVRLLRATDPDQIPASKAAA
jgi:hypothetical protein